MDNSRFNTLVKVLVSRRPQRAVLPLLAAVGLGLTDPDTTLAAKKGGNDKKKRHRERSE